MQGNERLTPDEAVVLMHGMLDELVRCGMSPDEACCTFNDAAKRARSTIRVSLEETKHEQQKPPAAR
jgi:hypothetical protein